jgi:Mrp family chromosome partitioning ATPase
MEQLLNRLQEMADVVIFDSPPVGAFSDAAVLASKVDGVVLVVKAGRPQRDIVKSVPMLRQAGANLLGGVLNGVSIKQISSYYGRYYSAYNRERTESLPVYARWINKLKSLPSSRLLAPRGKSGAGRSSP